MEINQPAPDFALPDLEGRMHRLRDDRDRIVILNFWSCECPHSERGDAVLVARLRVWGPDVVLLSIAANRNEAAEALDQAARARGLPTVLLDAHQAVADAYAAQTTPHIFVIDRAGRLRYRGALDDVTFRQRAPTRVFLDEVIGALLEGRDPPLTDSPAYGCTIVREI